MLNIGCFHKPLVKISWRFHFWVRATLSLLVLFAFLRAILVNAQVLTAREVRSAMRYVPLVTVREEAYPLIRNYVTGSSNPVVHEAMRLLIASERSLVAELVQEQKVASAIVIDGAKEDWEQSSFVYPVLDTEINPIDSSLPMSNPNGSDFLERWGLVVDSEWVRAFFQPRALPRPGEDHHYRINFFDEEWRMVYAIVWINGNNVVQEWDTKTGQWLRYLDDSGILFAEGSVFEARVPRKIMSRLGYQ